MDRLDTFLARGIADELAGDVFSLEYANRWEASAARQAADLAPDRGRPSFPRRALALALAAVSRVSAKAVRRLDDSTADDLGRTFAPAK